LELSSALMPFKAGRQLLQYRPAGAGLIERTVVGTREGEVDLVPQELGGGFDVMKKIKRVISGEELLE
jgi:glycolate oxidase